MEIKFRGKRIQDGEWTFGRGCIIEDNGTAWISRHYHKGEWEQVDPATIGQFTTKQDSNKQDIYSGDTLLITYDDGETCDTTTVRCEDGAFVVDIVGQDYDKTAIGWAIEEWDAMGARYEVVGNAHDNPGLKP